MSYSEQLAQRKQAAVDDEAVLVAHFGPEANNCANWDDLWQANWMRILTNSSVSMLPDRLPPFGGWVSEDGRRAFADPPSIYSDKFLFYFAKQLVDDEATVAARVSDWLGDADEIDCDQLSGYVGKVATYLANYSLYLVSGAGVQKDMGLIEPEKLEAFFQNWAGTKDVSGLFISRPGVAVANRRSVPAVVVNSVLQAVRRQIENRRQQLQTEAIASPTLTRQRAVKEPRIAKLAQGIEPEEVCRMLTSLGMGSTYDKPGEWAAAFRALWVVRILTGNAPAILRWASQHVHLDARMQETFKKFWQNEWNEASQLTNDAQKTVFRNVLASAQRMLSTKGHR